MKSYRISVNGTSYDVTVEELGAAPAAAAVPAALSSASAPAARPATVSAPMAASPAASTGAPGAAGAAGAVGAAGAAGIIKSPMPGTLLSYKVGLGQAVKRGQVLLIHEAMKMENEIVAPVDGVVAALHAAEGASVSTGQLLIELACRAKVSAPPTSASSPGRGISRAGPRRTARSCCLTSCPRAGRRGSQGTRPCSPRPSPRRPG